MVAVIFSGEDSREPGGDDFGPREARRSDRLFESLTVAPIRKRIQNILGSGVFAAEEPDFVDAELSASLARFDFADIRHGWAVLATVVISAAAAARAEDYGDGFVQVVDGAREVRS